MNNLPVELTTFVGRRRDLAEAKRLLADTSLLTLTGPGGVGKTRLARRLAAAVSRSFPDGVWMVDLALLTEEGLLDRTVAEALGVRDQSTRPALASLIEYLADKRLLLVLDNCEHLLDACAKLIDRLLRAAPRLRVLTTSRQALRVGGEQVFPVSPLSVPEEDKPSLGTVAQFEATALFAERAAAVSPDFVIDSENCRSVIRLCRRLDGIPLAIELAAVWLRKLSVSEVLDRMDDRFGLLTCGSRAALPRQQTLRAAIDWSYRLCSERERTLWNRLSVFVGGCDLDAAEAVCSGNGIDPDEMYLLMAGLVEKSIVSAGEHGAWMRYRMLETVHQYGAERLAESGEQQTQRRRHRDYFRRLTVRADEEWFGPNQVDWYVRLGLERSNIRVALDFSLATPGEATIALEMLTQPWSYWHVSESLGEARLWIDRAIDLVSERSGGLANALAWNAWWALLQGDRAAATRLLDRARAMGEEFGDSAALARVALSGGRAALFGGDYEGAMALLREALEYYRAHDHLEDTWLTLYQLSQGEALLGRTDRVSPFGEQCIALAKDAGAPMHLSYAMWVAGLSAWVRGDMRRAHTMIMEALRIKRTFNDLFGTAMCFEVLAWATAVDGDAKRAARLLGSARMVWQRNGTSVPNLGHVAGSQQECERRLRGRLGVEAYESAFEDGSGFTVPQAFDYAIGHPVDKAPPTPSRTTESGLTRRQLEVAGLVADGLGNQDIASRLVISQRTAEAHVENILIKLGFERRSQIAAWFAGHAAVSG